MKRSFAWGLGLGLFLVLGSGVLCAQAGTEKLSLEDIFLKPRVQPGDLPGFQWSADGSAFYYLKKNAQGVADLWRQEAATGQERVFVQASELKWGGTSQPKAIDAYQVAPDESFVLFMDSLPARSLKTGGDVYRFRVADRKFEPILESDRDQMNIQLSPDGKKLAFIRAGDLYVQDLSTLTEERLTRDGSDQILNGVFDWAYEEEFSIISGWKWSPDSRAIAFWRTDQSKVPLYPFMDYRDPHASVRWMRYPKPGDENSSVSVRVVRPGTGTAPQLLWEQSGRDGYLPRLDWLPDSLAIAVQILNRAQNELSLVRIDLSGSARVLLVEREKTWVEVSDDLRFLRGSGPLAGAFVWSSERSGYKHLELYDAQGKLIRSLTSGEWEVGDLLGVDEVRGKILFTGNRDSLLENHLYESGLWEATSPRRLTSAGVSHSVSLTPSLKGWIDGQTSVRRPGPIEWHPLSDGSSRTLVANQLPVLDALALGQTEFFSFLTSEGVPLNGLMIRPADSDPTRKYPVLLAPYGGPGSQLVKNAWGGSKMLWYHYLAQNGVIVVTVDNRGTGGRGKAFRSVTYRNLGELEARDQIETARYLAQQPGVDPARIGMWGWSYGGYLTSLTLAKGGALFKAGISVAPVTDWAYYDSIYTERYMGQPGENPEGYRRSSPITYASGLQARLLVIHGTDDDNVHFQNTVSWVDALISEDKPVEVLIYPYRTHGIYEGSRYTRLHLYRTMTEFLQSHL